jgi:hypothetical protein
MLFDILSRVNGKISAMMATEPRGSPHEPAGVLRWANELSFTTTDWHFGIRSIEPAANALSIL